MGVGGVGGGLEYLSIILKSGPVVADHVVCNQYVT